MVASKPAAAKGFSWEASAERLCGTYRRDPVDRVPIISPIGWGPNQDIDKKEFGDWRDEENFRKVARMVQDYCDPHPVRNAVGYPGVWAGTSYQRFLEASSEHIEKLPPERLSEIRTRHTTILHTPKGDLRWSFDQDEGILTNWDMEKPVKSFEDVERILSVPYSFTPPDPEKYGPHREKRAKMGENALGGCGINSMVAMLCGMMDYALLLEWVISEPGIVKTLADTWLERVSEKVAWLQSQGVGPFWHFNGVERATPPMMGPRQWEQLVEPYDGEIMRRIKAADPNARIHVHCHGKCGKQLDSFVKMGVDSIDPVEPAPQGNIDMAEAKRKYDGKLVFFGNIQFLDMETREPDEIEELVRSAIEDGGKQNVVLCPSAGPHERPSDRFTANAIRYIEAGLKYGEM